MKINVTVSIDVEPEEWYATYGFTRIPGEVRKDIKDYVFNAVNQLPGLVDAGAEVTLK